MSSRTLPKPGMMSKTTSSSSSSSTSSTSSIVALPSLSSQLFILPQAKNLDSLPVHYTSTPQRHAESEAKLKKALERNVARDNLSGMVTGTTTGTGTSGRSSSKLTTSTALGGQQGHPSGHQHQYPPRTCIPQPIYSEPSSPISHSPPIMMRPRQQQPVEIYQHPQRR